MARATAPQAPSRARGDTGSLISAVEKAIYVRVGGSDEARERRIPASKLVEHLDRDLAVGEVARGLRAGLHDIAELGHIHLEERPPTIGQRQRVLPGAVGLAVETL